jgi:hypothetical protein
LFLLIVFLESIYFKAPERPTDPIKIFERLPNLPGTPNDLWRGQAEAEHVNENETLSDLI